MSRILIVEDDRGVGDLFSRALSSRGYDVLVATTAETALNEVDQFQPDAILLDLRMPALSGLEFLRWMRTLERASLTPVAVITGDIVFVHANQLARLAVANGYDVVISNSRGPHSLKDLISELGPRSRAATVAEAAAAGDLVVVTIPLKHYRSVPVEPLAGKVVVDTNNYYSSVTAGSRSWRTNRLPPRSFCRRTCRLRRSSRRSITSMPRN